MAIHFLKSIDSSKNKNLVIVRAGAESLHKHYFYEDTNQRSWDRMVLSYTAPTELDLNNCEFVVQGGLSKWTDCSELLGMDFFSKLGYEYVLLVDDDLVPSDHDAINILFERAKQFGFEVCQPSLTHDSYYSWVVTLQSPAFHARYTNFVECMCPVFSRNFLTGAQQEIGKAVSGCGLDLIFSELCDPSKNLIGIVDDISFRHTKPVDLEEGGFYKHLRAHGVDSRKEIHDFMQRYGMNKKDIVTIGGIPKVQSISI